MRENRQVVILKLRNVAIVEVNHILFRTETYVNIE